MKLPFFYTLATVGVATFTCLVILFLAGPPTVVAESNEKPAAPVPSTWMSALMEKAQSFNLSSVVPGPEPESEAVVEFAPDTFEDIQPEIEEENFDYTGRPQFAKYEGPSTFGGTANQNQGANRSHRSSSSERLLRSVVGNSSGGGSGSQSGIGGGAVIALAGQGNSGPSSYREKLINTLLESLDDDEIAELVENQKQRKQNSK